MGISYTLIKQECPEAFDLGKGFWDYVFDRKYGTFIPVLKLQLGSNFEESFRIDAIPNLASKIKKYLLRWDEPDLSQQVATRIIEWAASSEIYLINYWEELEYYKERKWRKKCAAEFTDLTDKLSTPLYYYKLVNSVHSNT